MADKARARPVRLRRYAPELQTYVSSIVAYRAWCDCGWRGSSRADFADARADAAAHERRGHAQPPPG